MGSDDKKLSVVINTKNEERNISDCINSVKEIADEIIVVDMHSSDNTVGIAKKLGAEVYKVKDYGWVEPVREYSFSKSKYNWILMLDADERIPEKLGGKILEIIKNNEFDVVDFPRKDIFFGKWIRYTKPWWPDYQIRLFKKGYIKLTVAIHPLLKIKGKVLKLEPKEENAIVHYNAENVGIWLEKIDRHTSKEKYFESRKNLTAKELLSIFDEEVTLRFIVEEGFKDGFHGYVLSKFMEFYKFLEFVKYWEKNGYREIFSDEVIKEAVRIRYGLATKEKLDMMKNQISELSEMKASKFFKIWQIYCNLRKRFFREK